MPGFTWPTLEQSGSPTPEQSELSRCIQNDDASLVDEDQSLELSQSSDDPKITLEIRIKRAETEEQENRNLLSRSAPAGAPLKEFIDQHQALTDVRKLDNFSPEDGDREEHFSMFDRWNDTDGVEGELPEARPEVAGFEGSKHVERIGEEPVDVSTSPWLQLSNPPVVPLDLSQCLADEGDPCPHSLEMFQTCPGLSEDFCEEDAEFFRYW